MDMMIDDTGAFSGLGPRVLLNGMGPEPPAPGDPRTSSVVAQPRVRIYREDDAQRLRMVRSYNSRARSTAAPLATAASDGRVAASLLVVWPTSSYRRCRGRRRPEARRNVVGLGRWPDPAQRQNPPAGCTRAFPLGNYSTAVWGRSTRTTDGWRRALGNGTGRGGSSVSVHPEYNGGTFLGTFLVDYLETTLVHRR